MAKVKFIKKNAPIITIKTKNNDMYGVTVLEMAFSI